MFDSAPGTWRRNAILACITDTKCDFVKIIMEKITEPLHGNLFVSQFSINEDKRHCNIVSRPIILKAWPRKKDLSNDSKLKLYKNLKIYIG